MCTTTEEVQLCAWATETTTRASIVRLSLTTGMSAEEIARAVTADGDGKRTHTHTVRMVRRAARLRGCFLQGHRCPTCPPEKPTPTPLGGQCIACRGRPAPVAVATLPPPPALVRGHLLGSLHGGALPPSTVPIPARVVALPAPAVAPRQRMDLDPWSRRVNPMDAA